MEKDEQRKHLKRIARLGGLARMKIYGNFGTKEGRSLGGKNSIKRNLLLGNKFKKALEVKKPPLNEDLAELLGILMGDGHLSEYQAMVTTNSVTDIEHALFISNLFEKIFGLKPTLKRRLDEKSISVVVSSVNLVKILNKLGMPIGNKLSFGLKTPDWISSKIKLEKRFLRGLMDTDGCVYLDHHKIKDKDYYHLGLNFCSFSPKLRGDVVGILKALGFNPTCKKSQKSVLLRRQKEIKRYFEIVGSSNSKHLKRYKKFVGRVPKRS